MENIVISLTSKKNRFNKCGETVKSLLYNYPTARIFITIPREDAESMRNLISSGNFGNTQDLGRLNILYADGIPSKYNRIILAMEKNPDSPIISVSDGAAYSEGSLDGLINMHRSYPESICRLAACDIKVSFDGESYSAEAITSHETSRKHIIKLTYGPGTIYPPSRKSGFADAWRKFFSENLITENCSEDTYNGIIADYLGMHIRTLDKSAVFSDSYAENTIKEIYGTVFPRPEITSESADGISGKIAIMTVAAKDNAVPPMVAESPIRHRFNVDAAHNGKNIDGRNRWMCELTGLYYMWKNWTSEIIGLEHYRRFFVEGSKSYNVHDYKILDAQKIEDILQKYDFIVTYHQHAFGKHAYLYIKDSGNTQKFSSWLDFIDEKNPGFKTFCMNYLATPGTFICCNMFIAKKSSADEYCKWIFENMGSFFNLHPAAGMPARIMGYMAEFTFGAWLMFTGKKIYLCNHIRFDKKCLHLDEIERTTVNRDI